jgi:hypothetical protein
VSGFFFLQLIFFFERSYVPWLCRGEEHFNFFLNHLDVTKFEINKTSHLISKRPFVGRESDLCRSIHHHLPCAWPEDREGDRKGLRAAGAADSMGNGSDGRAARRTCRWTMTTPARPAVCHLRPARPRATATDGIRQRDKGRPGAPGAGAVQLIWCDSRGERLPSLCLDRRYHETTVPYSRLLLHQTSRLEETSTRNDHSITTRAPNYKSAKKIVPKLILVCV